MVDTCHMCGELAENDCVNCNRPTCSRHGTYVGDHFLCRECIREEEEND